jgi:hypothetical protein
MSRKLLNSLRSAAAAALLFPFCAIHAIEEPKPPPESQTAPAEPRPAVSATDEARFYERLQRVSLYRDLKGLGVPADAIDALSKANADVAVASLGALANQGNHDINVALVRLQHWCSRVMSSRPADPQTQISKLTAGMPAERAARAAGVINAEADFLNRGRASCRKAVFDYNAIEAHLRAAADAGHPASATELAQFVRDPAKRQALLQAGIDKHYPPAAYAVATNLLVAVQRGQTTENVGSIRELLKLAGRSIPKAKLDLANCMALGCDGHPADALTAQAFGIDAARDGEPTAFLSMMRMPWGGRLTRSQLLAWQYFGDRLNEAGCMGEAYIPTSMALSQSIQLLEKGQEAKVLDAAKAQAEDLWRDNSARAMKENGCG